MREKCILRHRILMAHSCWSVSCTYDENKLLHQQQDWLMRCGILSPVLEIHKSRGGDEKSMAVVSLEELVYTKISYVCVYAQMDSFLIARETVRVLHTTHALEICLFRKWKTSCIPLNFSNGYCIALYALKISVYRLENAIFRSLSSVVDTCLILVRSSSFCASKKKKKNSQYIWKNFLHINQITKAFGVSILCMYKTPRCVDSLLLMQPCQFLSISWFETKDLCSVIHYPSHWNYSLNGPTWNWLAILGT